MEKLMVSKAAKILDCHPETVRRLERKGELKARRDYRGFRVFNLEDLWALKEKRDELKESIN